MRASTLFLFAASFVFVRAAPLGEPGSLPVLGLPPHQNLPEVRAHSSPEATAPPWRRAVVPNNDGHLKTPTSTSTPGNDAPGWRVR
ncbi:hypothetical protein C8F01DRAFT_1103266 [Mycena amicta]|nr:hypothetical protein C8F01DRAFT_1103266 [Mycena amicta]